LGAVVEVGGQADAEGSAHPQRGVQTVSREFANSEVDGGGNASGGGR
jgi:hypothetical protein